MLLARQVSGQWRCKARTLIPAYEECLSIGAELRGRGCSWYIEHIYREFNATADSLVNEALDRMIDEEWRGEW